MFCRQEAAQLREHLDEIRKFNAELYIVGSGTQAMAKEFRETFAPDVKVLVDPERKAYAAAGLRRGLWATLHPRVIVPGARLFFGGGARQGRVQGDPLQQGGLLVVAPPGKAAYAYANNHSADRAPAADWLAALREAAKEIER
ncbi:MAG: AhpC/TSA family protein [Planctomycetes bacterium]|nr:AhpC/TSA family protein [Planctomycetota bacterium]